MKPAALITKPHYLILDGLRGVAAVWVVAFHIFEAHATSHFDQVINHGYLAVDFFFCFQVLLSGMLMIPAGAISHVKIFSRSGLSGCSQ